MAVTQFIAHDREVYDVAWLPNSTVIFVSVGVDSSLRAFDLWSLKEPTSDGLATIVAAAAHHFQARRPQLHKYLPPGRLGHPDT